MEEKIITLDKVAVGKRAKVVSLSNGGNVCRRLQSVGFVEGTFVNVLHKSPFGEPTAYFIRGAVIAIRAEDAAQVFVFV